jgi:hypothetical protein
MRILLLLSILAGAAFGQEASTPPNFMRMPKLTLVPPIAEWNGGAPAVQQEVAIAKPRQCAIPLVVVPADPNIDRGIFVPGQNLPGSRMHDVIPPAPSCGDKRP